MASLSNVTANTSFGGGGIIPLNLNQYRRGNSFLGWNGGVASHENNSNIPAVGIGGTYTGNLKLSDFNSPAHRDFLSGNTVSDVSTSGSPPEAAVGYATYAALTAVGCGSLNSIGTANRLIVGKSTYDWWNLGYAETANIEGVFDYSVSSTTVDSFAVVMTGDQRRTTWGGSGEANVGGTAGFAPTFITIGSNTLSFANAITPNGDFDGFYTSWEWTTPMNISPSGNFNYSISIFATSLPPPPPPPPPPPGTVNITNQIASDLSKAGVGGTGVGRYRLSSTGQAFKTDLSGTLISISGEWLVSGSSSDYDVRATVLTTSGFGSFVGPGSGWYNLGTQRDWTLTTFNNSAQYEVLFEIRDASTLVVLDSATISFDVDSAP